MEILQYTSDILTPVTQFYNHLTAEVPHCYPAKEEEFANVMSVAAGEANRTDDDLESEIAFVAMKNGMVKAFIHAGQRRYGKNNEVHEGVVRFFGYERGARHAGQTLLEKAEVYLKTFNVPKIIVFCSDAGCYCYDFYHFSGGKLSNTLDHIHALLGHNDYSPRYSRVFLDWQNYSVTPTPSSLPVTFSVDWEKGRGQRPNCTVRVHQEGEKIGICESVCGGEFSNHPDAQDWAG